LSANADAIGACVDPPKAPWEITRTLSNRYGLAIRAADTADADGVGELIRAAGLTFDQRGLAKRLEAVPSQSGAVLLAVEWGPPSGIIALHWSWTLTAELKVAYVSTLLVDPEQRRRGIARLLLKAASQIARSTGCGELRLLFPAEADHLREFCLATGFEDTGSVFTRPLRKRA
jgi:aminoglycoside 6'-N-acetyltransferase I